MEFTKRERKSVLTNGEKSMSKCKVLIVDDIAENIAQVVDMLSNLDIEIKKAYGGKEAIELVETYKPNIVLLDLMMPEVNGWDVIQHIRAKYDKNEMIIIITSLLNNKDNIDECCRTRCECTNQRQSRSV